MAPSGALAEGAGRYLKRNERTETTAATTAAKAEITQINVFTIRGDRIMENINEIARLIQRGMESSATATRAVMQAIQLGYTLAEMEHQEKKAG